ncbi:hypothetical protein CALVIDRAFT_540825 [Calocera viscosa TUFC12733]|uniref:Uncharacterized protein n=1 Tax=Calocera viscosa (strain TUFC12733) TaxID=1330018 RepID=A0A167IDX4_CALVF|nr:hypothetical protein CALVIDRAFT_540825 [Calocera viscosa TUFC12733]
MYRHTNGSCALFAWRPHPAEQTPHRCAECLSARARGEDPGPKGLTRLAGSGSPQK